jgi:uncharacterized protein
MTNRVASQNVHRTDSYAQQWHIWHAQRIEELTSPHGYLAPVSINWINDGQSTTIDGVPGTWSSENDVLIYTPDEGAQVHNAGTLVERPFAFVPSVFGEEALGYLDYGDIRVEVNAQTNLNDQDRHLFWIRVKDPDAERRRAFKGIEHFPIDRKWRLPATFRRANDDELDIHDSVVKTVLQSYPVLGFVEFDYEDERHSLVVSNVFGHVTVFFSDETTGKETYDIGRVLHLDPLKLDSLDAVDFNYAFNYPCAFSPYCTCPIPSRRNHLPFAVTAGEKTPEGSAQY